MKKIVILLVAMTLVVIATSAFAEKMVVNTAEDPLRVRAWPSGPVIGQIAKGKVVNVLNKDKWWAEINWKGGTAYVYAPYLAKATGAPHKPSGKPSGKPHGPSMAIGKYMTVAINSGYLNVRSGPGTDYTSIGKLYKDESVFVLSKKAGWYKIKWGAKEAYVSAKYLK